MSCCVNSLLIIYFLFLRQFIVRTTYSILPKSMQFLTCPALTTGPSLQSSSKGSEILMFLVHLSSLSINAEAMFSWNVQNLILRNVST